MTHKQFRNIIHSFCTKFGFQIYIFGFFFLFANNIYAKTSAENGLQHENEKQVRIGNFTLPFSQWVSPLVGFGENILNQGTWQTWLDTSYFFGKNYYYSLLSPNLLYGLTNKLSLLLNVPVSPQNRDGTHRSRGLNDILAQLEYAYWSLGSTHDFNQATIVGNISIPTGSVLQTPPTGLGSTSFFIGATYSYTSIHWYIFFATGVELPTNLNGTKSGNEILYQIGFGRNFPSPRHWVFDWMIEGDGTYTAKDRIKGALQNDSGGNVVWVTPSVFLASTQLIFQIGAGYPVIQTLNGNQTKQVVNGIVTVVYTF